MFRKLRTLPLFSPATSVELRTWQWLAIIGGGLAWLLPVGSLGFSVCFFYNLTGWPCPGCGMTRAVHFALHLDPLHAFYHHPVGLFGALGIAFFWLTALWEPAGRLFERVKRHTALALMTVAVAMLGFGLWRAVAIGAADAEGGASARTQGFGVVLKDRRLISGQAVPVGSLWRAMLGRPSYPADNSKAPADELN